MRTVLLDFHIGSAPRLAAAEKLLLEEPVWISVSLWRYEVGKCPADGGSDPKTRPSTRRQPWRIWPAQNDSLWRTIENLDPSAIFEIAIKHGLTMYDASYVWAARRRGLKLRTRDEDILKFCPDVAEPMPLVS